jgi:hypothetical protein
MIEVAFFAAATAASLRDDNIDPEPDKLGSDLSVALTAPFRPAILDRNGASLDPSKFV